MGLTGLVRTGWPARAPIFAVCRRNALTDWCDSPRSYSGLACIAIVLYIWIAGRNNDVTNPNVEFKPPTAAQGAVRSARRPSPGRSTASNPLARATSPPTLEPPFKPLWRFNANQLLEFSPILVRGVLYVVRKDSRVYAIDAKTGRQLWTHKVGKLSAASPAYDDGRIFVVTLSGRIVAMNAKTGNIKWAKNLGSRSESSPLILEDSVIFGSESGKLYRVQARATAGPSGPTTPAARSRAARRTPTGKLYVGAYGGTVHAVRASQRQADLAQLARAARASASVRATSTPRPPSPTAASTSATPTARCTRSRPRAARSAGRAEPAPTSTAPQRSTTSSDVGPTIFFGSYSGNVLRAQRRATATPAGPTTPAARSPARRRWSATSSTSRRSTRPTPMDSAPRSGKRVFARGSGAYNPAISDGHRLYFTGYESISAYVKTSTYAREAKERRAALRRDRRD